MIAPKYPKIPDKKFLIAAESYMGKINSTFNFKSPLLLTVTVRIAEVFSVSTVLITQTQFFIGIKFDGLECCFGNVLHFAVHAHVTVVVHFALMSKSLNENLNL